MKLERHLFAAAVKKTANATKLQSYLLSSCALQDFPWKQYLLPGNDAFLELPWKQWQNQMYSSTSIVNVHVYLFLEYYIIIRVLELCFFNLR